MTTLHQQGGETRAGATSEAVEDQEALKAEGVEGIISSSESLVTGHLSVRLDPMFQAVKLPACIADLDTSLTDVDG
ncbi:hypothetical protein FQN60_002415, partial [Etheostoma spectabile]